MKHRLPSHIRLTVVLTALTAVLIVVPAVTAGPLEDADEDWRDGKVRAAVIKLKNVLQKDPDDAAARTLLARIYLDSGDAAAAEQEIERARRTGLDDAQALPVLAEALLAQGRTADLLERIQPSADMPPSLQATLNALRGEALLAEQSFDAAEAAFDEAIEAAPDSLRGALGKARLQALRGETDEARAAITALAEQHPDSALVWTTLGTMEYASQNHSAAADAFTKALEHERGAWAHHYRRALARIETGDIDGTQEDIDAIAAVSPAFPGLAYLRGRVQLLEGEPGQAAEELESYLRAAPDDPRAIYYAALALFQSERYAQAEEYLNRLSNRFEGSAMTATLLGLTRLQQGDAAGAEAAVAPFAEAEDATPATIEVLRRALAAQGREADAAQQIERLVERFPDLIPPRLALARQLQDAGDAPASLENLRPVIEQDPDNVQARVLLIRGLLLAEDNDAAMSEAEELLAAAPEAPLAHTVYAAVLTRMQDLDGARAAFQKALDIDPSFTRAALGLAVLEMGSDRPESARKTLDGLLAADPDNTSALLAVAGLERREGGADAFIERLQTGLEANPSDLALRLILARAYLQTDRAATALALLQDAPTDQAEQPGLLLLRAQAESAAGRHQSAVVSLTRLAELSPESVQTRFLLAVANARAGDLRAAETQLLDALRQDEDHALTPAQLSAILAAVPTDAGRSALLDRLLRATPGHPRIAAAHARFAAQQRDFDSAIATFQSLTETYPDDESHVIGLAQSLSSAGRAEEANAAVKSWLSEHPETVGPRMLLAQLALEQDRPALAVDEYRRFLELRPDTAVALNNLAMLLAEDEPKEALELAERGLAQRPEDPAFMDTLGLVLLNLDEPERAREVLAKAHAATPDPSIAFRYARALTATGAPDQARRVLRQNAAANYPEKAAAEALLQELDQ